MLKTWWALSIIALGLFHYPPDPPSSPIGYEDQRQINAIIDAPELRTPSGVETRIALLQGQDLSEDTRGNAQNFVSLVEADANDGSGTHKCVGTAITLDMVLTAGHCLRDVHNVRVKMVSNTDPLEFERIEARRFTLHPKTNDGFDGKMYATFNEDVSYRFHDIAIIHLIEQSEFAIPVTIAPPDMNVEDLDDPQVFAFGRGRDDATHKETGSIEFVRLLSPTPMRSGRNYYKAYLDVRKSQPQAICVGDSGGAITVSAEDEYVAGRNVHYLIGLFTMLVRQIPPKDGEAAIAEWKDLKSVPSCGTGAGYLNVQREIDWIEETMEDLRPGSSGELQVFGRD